MVDEDKQIVSTKPSNRLALWAALAGFSAIVLGAHEIAVDQDHRSKKEKWVTGGSSMTMGLGFLGMCGHMVPKKFAGTLIEGGLATLCVALLCGFLPTLMNPDNDLAQTYLMSSLALGYDGGPGYNPDYYNADLLRNLVIPFINNANLYFFGWGAFIAAMTILMQLKRDVKVARFTGTSDQILYWSWILVASVVVMWSGRKIHKELDDLLDPVGGCEDAEGSVEELCRRTTFAAAGGGVCTILAIIAVLASKVDALALMVELVLSFIILTVYAFLAGIATFDTGPARKEGNLYFSVWIGLILCAFLFFRNVVVLRDKYDSNDEAEEAAPESALDRDVKEAAEEEEA